MGSGRGTPFCTGACSTRAVRPPRPGGGGRRRKRPPADPAVRAGTTPRGVRARYPRHVAVIVQKYGGAPAGTVGPIRGGAPRGGEARRQGCDPVVGGSRLGQSPPELLAIAHRRP